MKISTTDRQRLLKATNNLKDILSTASDMHDLYLSDIPKFDYALDEFIDVLKFAVSVDKDGTIRSYSDLVLHEAKNSYPTYKKKQEANK
tara:strand:- start:95 stop:361 length:267 start_codon:yes stop_codon:yes gene_type:complete